MLFLLAIAPALGAAITFASDMRTRFGLATVSSGTTGVTLAVAIVAAGFGWTGAIGWSDQLRLTAALTPMAATMAILVPLIALPVLLYAAGHESERGLKRLIVLLLLFVGGMELLVVAADLLTLLIGWEIVGACSWALIGHDWRDPDNPRGGLYAFVTTRFGDLGLFLAAMAAFAGAGSFAYADLAGLPSPMIEMVAFGILVSAAAKSGQVPFSPWLFRAMAGPTSVSALLHAATMVAAGAYVLIRLHPVLHQEPAFAPAAIGIGLVTALAGGLVAALQPHAKKLLAASTSAHYGLMFVAVGAGYPLVALLHLVAHAGFKALLFLAAGIAGEKAGTYELDRMGFGRALPSVAALSALGALTLGGVPPLAGAWTKEEIVAVAGHRGLWLAAGVMLAGGLSAAYAARFQLMAFGRREAAGGSGPGRLEYCGVGLLAGFSLLLSALWYPAIHDAVATAFGAEIPSSTLAELIASLALVALGLLAGASLARTAPALGKVGTGAALSDWLGLPSAIRLGITRPFSRLATSAAWFDDAVFDAVPRLVAATGKGIASHASLSDTFVVDRGVRLAAAFGVWLARLGDTVGEFVTDGLPRGTAGIVGFGGAEARQLQTGLTHQYYALLGGGAALLVVVLIIVA
ncbi:NADH-quinone oxidoreductase subunit L [Amorphus sp. 3PC139-8]|uniref:NADH-quinone oxidoreductase subunit 5 family protein n=1 Tax=Amorphus sp. 3PC139-8 TaxID=2735676 RepID=UPI00345D2BA6